MIERMREVERELREKAINHSGLAGEYEREGDSVWGLYYRGKHSAYNRAADMIAAALREEEKDGK